MCGLIFLDTLAGKTSSSLESRSGFHSLSSIFTSGHKYRNLNIYSFFSYSVNLVCSVWSVLSWRAQRHVNLCPFFRKLTDKKLMFILLRLEEVRVLNLKTCCTCTQMTHIPIFHYRYHDQTFPNCQLMLKLNLILICVRRFDKYCIELCDPIAKIETIDHF